MDRNNLFVWRIGPRQWQAHMPSNGFTTLGSNRDEALTNFDGMWAKRGDLRVIDGAPPLAADNPVAREARNAAPASERNAERDAALLDCWRRWAKKLHPDDGHHTVAAADAMDALTELYELAKR